MPVADEPLQWTPFTHGLVCWEYSTPAHGNMIAADAYHDALSR